MSLLQRLWGLRKPRRLSSVVLRRLHLSHLFSIHANGLHLKFFPTINLTYLWENPDFSAPDTQFLAAWLRPGDVMVDCGANIGELALFANNIVKPDGLVYAFEPHPRIYKYLETHTRLNNAQHVKLVHAAVGEKAGTLHFSDQAADDGNHVVTNGGLSVPVVTVDSVVPFGTKVRLLKVDVEGYEKHVFEGAARTLESTECVIFESADHLFGRYGHTSADVFALLNRYGFTVFRYPGHRRIEALPAGYQSVEQENCVAVRDVGVFLAKTGFELR